MVAALRWVICPAFYIVTIAIEWTIVCLVAACVFYRNGTTVLATLAKHKSDYGNSRKREERLKFGRYSGGSCVHCAHFISIFQLIERN